MQLDEIYEKHQKPSKMPFMIGKYPLRRTKEYLEVGKLVLKDAIKIFAVNYNTKGDHHQGAR